MEKKVQKINISALIGWKKGLAIDIAVVFTFSILTLIYVFPFLGEPDKSNLFSAPLIPRLAEIISWLPGLGMAKAITICLSIFIILGPVSFYFLSLKLSGRKLSAFMSTFFYSLPLEWFAAGRIKMAFLVGDGGHIAALTIIPIAGLFLLNFIRRGGFRSLALASLSLGIVALTSPFGLLVGIMILAVIAFSEFLLGEGKLKFLRFLVFLGTAVGFVAFWYNPGFILLFIKSNQGSAIVKTFINLIPISFVVIPVFATFGFLLFEKKEELQSLFVSLGLSLIFSLVSFADYIGHLFPSHPLRYLPPLGFSTSFLFSVLLTAVSDYLKLNGKLYKIKLTSFQRNIVRKALWVVTIGITTCLTITSLKSVWHLPESQFLKLWDRSANSSGVLEIKQQTNRISTLIGYLVTVTTIILTTWLWFKIRKQQSKKDPSMTS